MRTRFPVGYYRLHPNPGINFQMNRWVSYLGESALDDMRAIAPRLKGYPSYRREFLALAETALAQGRTLAAAYYRSAEFFMWADDPEKEPTRQRFLELVRDGYGIDDEDRFAIPYQDGALRGTLPAYRFTPDDPKGTIVVHGGYDSYIEEFLPVILAARDAGYDVVCFEGPGQGGALEDSRLPMTFDWHRPVKAVLDYFDLDDVTLIGVSLGGSLALRAAAFEPRVRRVVAYDVLFDFLDLWLQQANPAARLFLRPLAGRGAAPLFDAMMKRTMRKSATLDWGMRQGMHVLGVDSPFAAWQQFRRFGTRDVSSLSRRMFW